MKCAAAKQPAQPCASETKPQPGIALFCIRPAPGQWAPAMRPVTAHSLLFGENYNGAGLKRPFLPVMAIRASAAFADDGSHSALTVCAIIRGRTSGKYLKAYMP